MELYDVMIAGVVYGRWYGAIYWWSRVKTRHSWVVVVCVQLLAFVHSLVLAVGRFVRHSEQFGSRCRKVPILGTGLAVPAVTWPVGA